MEEVKAETRLREFKPHPGFQEEFFKDKTRIRFLAVGNQEGKTHICAVEHACIALGEHPHKKIRTPNIGIAVTAKSHKDGIEDELLPKLQQVCGSKDIKKIINDKQGRPAGILWRSNSITHFKSAEQDDISFESKTIDHAWFDEPMRRAIFIATMRGLMKSGGLLYWAATLLEEPWIYDEIMLPGLSGQDKSIRIFEGKGNENLAIPQEERDAFYSRLSPDELEVRKFGRPQHLTGRVFKAYDRSRHYIKPFDIPSHWPVWLSIDPHNNKPHCVEFIAASHNNILYSCNEIFSKCSIKDLGYQILDISSQYNMVNMLIDTSAQEEDWSKVSARQILDEVGVRTKLAQKKNLKKAGIHIINQRFHEDTYFVFENCVRLHRELTLQTFQKNKRDGQKVLEEPEKKWDDACLVAGTMVATPNGDSPIEQIKVGDRVITPFGIRKVTFSAPTRVVPVTTWNGITGSYDHPVFTYEDGFVDLAKMEGQYTASYLKWGALVKWKYQKLLRSMESNTISWGGKRGIILAGSQIIRRGKVLKDFMWRFGSFIAERQFLKAFTFITRMAILTITTTATLSVYRLKNTLKSLTAILKSSARQSLTALGRLPQSGMALLKGVCGTAKMQKQFGKIKSQTASVFASLVEGSFFPLRLAHDTATEHVKCASSGLLFTERTGLAKDAIQNIGHINTQKQSIAHIRALVYNLTVEDDNCFYANGALVGNTDNVRYIMVENPTYGGPAGVKSYAEEGLYRRI